MKIILRYFTVTVFLLFIFLSSSFSQTYEYIEVRDLETWSSIGFEYKPGKKWNIELDEQLRLKNNSTEIDKYLTHGQVGYKFYKKVVVAGGVRYIRKNDNKGEVQGYNDQLRYNFDLSNKHKMSSFSLQYRFRYQYRFEVGEYSVSKENLRLKTSVGYNIKNWKLDPRVSAEIFNNMENELLKSFDTYRLTIGTSYKIKKIGKIGIFYRLERELNETYPKTTNILGLKLKYTF